MKLTAASYDAEFWNNLIIVGEEEKRAFARRTFRRRRQFELARDLGRILLRVCRASS